MSTQVENPSNCFADDASIVSDMTDALSLNEHKQQQQQDASGKPPISLVSVEPALGPGLNESRRTVTDDEASLDLAALVEDEQEEQEATPTPTPILNLTIKVPIAGTRRTKRTFISKSNSNSDRRVKSADAATLRNRMDLTEDEFNTSNGSMKDISNGTHGTSESMRRSHKKQRAGSVLGRSKTTDGRIEIETQTKAKAPPKPSAPKRRLRRSSAPTQRIGRTYTCDCRKSNPNGSTTLDRMSRMVRRPSAANRPKRSSINLPIRETDETQL